MQLKKFAKIGGKKVENGRKKRSKRKAEKTV